MTIEANQVLKSFSGVDLLDDKGESITVGLAIANILITSEQIPNNKLKAYVLAQKFYRTSGSPLIIELDQADGVFVKKTIEDSKSYSILVIGQLLLILSK